MATLFSKFVEKTQRSITNTITANYTILNNDGITRIHNNAQSGIVVVLPALSSNQSRSISIRNNTVSGTITVYPNGTDKINSWNSPVVINQQWGQWDFTAGANEWEGKTDGNSTILYVANTSGINCDTTSNRWEDASGMNLPLTPGKWLLSFKARHWIYKDSGQVNIYVGAGLGITSGNNAADIDYIINFNGTTSSYQFYLEAGQMLTDIPYSVTTNTTVYLKIYYATSSGGATSHVLQAAAGYPVFLKARRIT